MPTGYTRIQIALHWLVFILVVLQFVLHDSIADAWERIEDGLEVGFDPLVAQHVFTGLLILLLVMIRMAIKAKRGAPALPENEPAILKLAAHGTHLALYALLILMPVSGAVAWFGGVEKAADGHEAMKVLVLVLVAVHVAGALFQHFVLKSNVLTRMRKPL
ncbi:cytochrome b [Maritimibacter sp. HL-12]|uniref:cytochrome b n=1 Tax=Maritimibacter sp. HL-12 TaxID=1162418 RepID=UPI000A0F0DB1|nr:cytochrome b/b6 domain-containing protein [Maritimibacter sp. HL-12]SMH49997.1 cytochrome b561 [Maritimibacter sp. HL-12]